jgi:hypothetical protein
LSLGVGWWVLQQEGRNRQQQLTDTATAGEQRESIGWFIVD